MQKHIVINNQQALIAGDFYADIQDYGEGLVLDGLYTDEAMCNNVPVDTAHFVYEAAKQWISDHYDEIATELHEFERDAA